MSNSSPRRRGRSRRSGPLFPTIWFSIIGIMWGVFINLAVVFLRPHPLTNADYMITGIGYLLTLFYFWVAFAVYKRRRYIFDIALVCAGLGLFNFPIGTGLSILLLSSLFERKHDFTK